MSQVRNRNGHYPYHANSVRRGIRIPLARVQDVRSYEKTQGRAKLMIEVCFHDRPSDFAIGIIAGAAAKSE